MDINELDLDKGTNEPINDGGTGSSQGGGQNGDGDATPISGKADKVDITNSDGNKPADPNKPTETKVDEKEGKTGEETDNSPTGELHTGDTIELGDITYTVDKDGNIVDKDGAIFKAAKDVDAWIAEQNIEEEEKEGEEKDGLSLSAIQEKIGITITDDKGKPVEFTNDAEGISSYVNSVMELKSKEIQDGTINKLYSDNPLLKQFNDYLVVNNGNPRGFGEIPDRSTITLDKDNISQQESIIKMAAQEFGNKSLNDNYIKYLKDTGGLYDEAKNQLASLVEKDTNTRKNIESQAEAARQQEQKDTLAYWKKVNDVINSKNIGGYKIPDSFIKTVNGTKITVTPTDFYDYLSKSKADENGNKLTQYQRDLNTLSPDEQLNKELIDSWLMFTGGSYKDLIDMAIKEEQVRTLRIKSKDNRARTTIKINRPTNGKTKVEDIIL